MFVWTQPVGSLLSFILSLAVIKTSLSGFHPCGVVNNPLPHSPRAPPNDNDDDGVIMCDSRVRALPHRRNFDPIAISKLYLLTTIFAVSKMQSQEFLF